MPKFTTLEHLGAPVMPDLPIHEALQHLFDRMMGRVVPGRPVDYLHPPMVAAFRDLVLRDDIFSGHCPIGVTVYEHPEMPGHVGWFFKVTDLNDILWFSIHKEHVDRHFPAELFPEGRPELPVYP